MDSIVENMILEMKKAERERHERLMTVLHYLQFTPGFYLTGSRFFGTDHDESDYDFFMKEDLMVMSILRCLGFSQDWNSGYSDSDPSVRAVLCFEEGPIKIHVQMIKSSFFDKKMKAQEKIRELFIALPIRMRQMSKADMSIIWRRYIMMS